jgi:ABC-type Fe3+-hydroxamate transport system substrate-binding protein
MQTMIRDDRKRELMFRAPPKRVVSLVPSDTLSLVDLGLEHVLVGRTDYCDTPASLADKVPAVGGTKNPRLEHVLDLAPDLVLANQEENTKSDLETLAQRGIRVYVAFPKRVREGLAHLAKLVRIFGLSDTRDAAASTAQALLREGHRSLSEIEEARKRMVPVRAFCPIWMAPLMTVHGSTYISDMMDLVGAQNVFSDRERRYPLAADHGKREPIDPGQRDVRYPRITEAELIARAPELILLPTEPHLFTADDARYLASLPIPAATFPAASTQGDRLGGIHFVDGKDLSWYGSRAVSGAARLAQQVLLTT